MSHSAELIQSIVRLLQVDYPASSYRYITEKAIPGTRMYPDVQVCDQDDRLVCVVEIGYTRPEKLTAYRKKLQIADVRWYDKAGTIHADVQEKVIKVSIQAEPAGTFVGYVLMDMIPCFADDCELTALCEAGVDVDCMEDPFAALEDVKILNAWCEYLPECTMLTVVTDHSRVWLHFFCDKCGEDRWIPKDVSCDVEAVAYELRNRSGRDFAREWDARKFIGTWADAQNFAKEYTGMDLCYADGEFINEEAEREFQRAATDIRVRAMATA